MWKKSPKLIATRGLVALISRIPFRILYILSDICYFIMYYVVRYRRKVVRRNLESSFPEKSHAEIIRIEKGFYRFLADVIFETCKLLTITPEEMREHIQFENVDEVNAILESGESISAYLGHYGNWEWISSTGLWLTKEAVAAQIYHKLQNGPMDILMKEMRERMGNICIDMSHTARYMAQAKKDRKPHIMGFISDQSPKRRYADYFIPFLNHEVPVITGTEKITKHFGYKAFFISMKRVKRGYYRCVFEPLHLSPETLPDYKLTELYFQRLEREIRENPELYLWSHNRFKYAKK